MRGQTHEWTRRRTHTLLVVRILVAKILAFSATEAELKKKKRETEFGGNRQVTLIPGHGSGEHSRLTLQDLWP